MPDRRKHRGPHPEDARLFGVSALPALRLAVDDLCWLWDRGYAVDSSLKLVGDRHRLEKRQRIAVARCAAPAEAVAERARKRTPPEAMAGRALCLDGYNVLTTLEAALGGAVVLVGRDGCYRDMASMHGSYRKVEETLPALRMLGELIARWDAGPCRWYFDSPVSNSGRLKTLLLELAAQSGWDWQVELVTDPDPLLSASEEVVATSDSVILDRCRHWTNLSAAAVQEFAPNANMARL